MDIWPNEISVEWERLVLKPRSCWLLDSDRGRHPCRLSAERTDSTLDVLDRRTNYRSRSQPIGDLKYLTYGFAYLQDMIDSAILEVHTGRAGEANPGRILKQYPYPSYIYDQ